jgi:uncharacterized protein YjbJ (UPF0337 family)
VEALTEATDGEEARMGDSDKLENMADEKLGEAKEAMGKAADDKDLEGEGKLDQTKADLKQAGEKVKDAFS